MYSDAYRAFVVSGEARRLADYLGTFSASDWDGPTACDRWCAGDVVAHLAAMGMADRIRRGLQGDLTAVAGQPATGSVNEDGFRDDIAARAIAGRGRYGDRLLAAFVASYEELDQLLAGLKPGDWDVTCYHAMGREPVRTIVDIAVTELAIHGWDIRSRREAAARLSPDSLPVLLNTVGRSVRRAFRPDRARPAPVRYRFTVEDPAPAAHAVVLGPEGARHEADGGTSADVVFRCDAQTYVLVMAGRLTVPAAVAEGRLTYAGPGELVDRFARAFVGG